jgi:general secretion pathway protein D
MQKRSAGKSTRRGRSRPGHCALAARLLGLFIALGLSTVYAQPPELADGTPDVAAVESAAPPKLPPPTTSSTRTAAHDDSAVNTDDLAAVLERKGDLNLHGLTLNAALFTISEQWHVNIVAGNVEGTVNGVFKQAPLREILDAILLSNGYNYRAVGKSLVVSSTKDLGQTNPFFLSATIPVKSADIDEVVEGAKLLSTPQGQVRPMKSARSIIVVDFPDRVQAIRDFVATLDSATGNQFAAPGSRDALPLEVGHYRTQYITARSAEQALAAVLSKSGRAAVMEREDRLVVTDFAPNLAMVEKVLDMIDRPRPQVRITALIYDISLEDVTRLGINWNQGVGRAGVNANGDLERALTIDSVTQVPFAPNAAGSTLTFMNLSRDLDITAVILALQRANDARLLADPNVAVLENEEAIFQSVSEIPYQQLTQTQQGGQIGTTAFKDAGITLKVRPKIAADGTIEMQVMPEFSRLTGFTPGDNQPIIDRRTANTVLRIANKQTVVIGGLRERRDVGDFKGIPYLKDMRLVGRLFRSRDTTVHESELIVFISPEIIHYADEPRVRQQMVEDTVRCRLDQIPEAEGCPPCCRRLPPGTNLEMPFPGEPASPGVNLPNSAGELEGATENGDLFLPRDSASAPTELLPAPQPADLPPLSAARVPSAERQFGAAGRADPVCAMPADARLRRLPGVDPQDSQSVIQVSTAPANLSIPLGENAGKHSDSDSGQAQPPRMARRLPVTETR